MFDMEIVLIKVQSLFFNKTLDILFHKVYSYYSSKDNTDIKKGQKDAGNFS